MTNETPTALEKVKNAITNKITALITTHNEDTSAHGLDKLKNDILTSIQEDGGISSGMDEEQFEAMLDEAIFEETHTTLKLYWLGGNNPHHIKIDNVEATPDEHGVYTFNNITVNEWHDINIIFESKDITISCAAYLGNNDNYKESTNRLIDYQIYVDKNNNEYVIEEVGSTQQEPEGPDGS